MKSCFCLVLLGTTLLFPLSIGAQSICPVTKLKARILAGYVQDAGTPDAVAVQATKLELRRLDDGSLVKDAITDSSGFFRFDGLAKDKYLLSIFFLAKGIEIAPKFDVVVQIVKTRADNDPNRLEIKLGLTCFESTARTIPSGENK